LDLEESQSFALLARRYDADLLRAVIDSGEMGRVTRFESRMEQYAPVESGVATLPNHEIRARMSVISHMNFIGEMAKLPENNRKL